MKRDYTNVKADDFYRSVKDHPELLPFSFTYDGIEYRGISERYFKKKKQSVDVVGQKETVTREFDFFDELTITLVLTHYYSHGVTEWTVWIENRGEKNSKVIEKMQSEITFVGAYPQLKGILGDYVNQYGQYCEDLTDRSITLSADTGRATHVCFPYFDLEYGDGGAMLAIGWAGTWSATFCSDGKNTKYTASSVNGLKTFLKSGEKIRSALFVVAEYGVRNESYATNFWRSWYVEYNLPKADSKGNALVPFSTCCFANDTGLPNSDGSISERFSTWKPSLDIMIKNDVKVDYRWFDAGWYVRPDGKSEEVDWWGSVGTWTLDPVKWPGKTFLESTDYARANGMKTLVWFEPERVTDPENLVKNYGYDASWAIRKEEGSRTVSNNIGIPECLKWTTDRICKMLRENKVEMYREDNNCDARSLWTYLDDKEGENRKGITECKFIIGHYKMWDDIIQCTSSYGGCAFVDSCASGGGRNDLESMRRSIPLLRSDSDRTTIALRLSMTTAFNKWIPFCGANTKEKEKQLSQDGISDVYTWRASYLPALNVDERFVHNTTGNFDNLKFGLEEWKKVAPYLLKEFYVLTPWHRECDKTAFTAMSYFDPESERGVLLAFRQETNDFCDTLTVTLPYAKGRKCVLTNEDTHETSLIEDGTMSVCFSEKRSAKLFWVELK